MFYKKKKKVKFKNISFQTNFRKIDYILMTVCTYLIPWRRSIGISSCEIQDTRANRNVIVQSNRSWNDGE